MNVAVSSNDNKNVEGEAEDSPYENMIRSFTNRGKNKRKVKLVEDKLIQFAFGDSDSDDDEDFTLDSDREVDSDHSDYDDGNGDNDDSTSEEDENNGAGDVDDANAEEEGNDGGDEDSQHGSEVHPQALRRDAIKKGDMSQLENSSIPDDDESVVSQEHASNDYLKKACQKRILVCGICLESESNEEDEILECDNCGITVHEGCYGDIDLPESDDKSDSDAPTEPWFCEPCKAGLLEPPICELCPNSGGIFKLTDSKKWVHLICALYTPFVGFRDVSTLQTVVLEDIKSSMWGSKECMFCPDDNYARTGVCINCDAGMCRTSFHVTCGQINGFLSDIPDKMDEYDETDCPDLLYAHCKLHSVKQELEKRKRGWLSFQSHVQKFEKSGESDELERIGEALNRGKHDFLEYQRNIVQPKQPGQEYNRLLSSCPEACIMLAKKAEILGMLKHPGYNVAAALSSGKMVKHEPNLSIEFLNYFYKREMESKELTKKLENAGPLLLLLQKEQRALTKETEDCHGKLEKVRAGKESLFKSCNKLHGTLHEISGRKFQLPNSLKPKQVKQNKGKLEETTKLLNTIVHKCATCQQTSDQHLLVQCDTCKQHYHLACVDPPLLRMPKRSDNYLWQCTECDSSDESGEETEESDTERTRRKRKRTIKEPEKFVPDELIPKGIEKNRNLKTSKKRKNDSSTPFPNSKKKKANPTPPKSSTKGDKITSTPKNKKEAPQRKKPENPKKEKPAPEKLDDCYTCQKGGDKNSLVKCDECLKCYHFKTCLDPPYAKTPKGRYYGWICEECDESEEELVDSDVVVDFGDEEEIEDN